MWVRTPDGYRNLTVSECEKLQTVPVGYTRAVSPTPAKKLLSNAWTVDVIAHIMSGLNAAKDIHDAITRPLPAHAAERLEPVGSAWRAFQVSRRAPVTADRLLDV
jgi:hypothetical protein